MKIMHYFKLVACLSVLVALFMNSSGSVSASFTCGGWSVVPSPNNGPYANSLLGVAAISASEIWAVGYYTDFNNNELTRIEHWNGKKWKVVPSPNPMGIDSYLSGVAGVSANDVWAVGSYYSYPNTDTLIEHWDGTNWTIFPSPSSGSYSQLNAVAAISSN